jgi:hypothetical protein
MLQLRRGVAAASLVLYPLLFLAYFAVYPAYGLLESARIAMAFDGHAGAGTLASGFGIAACLLGVPATLALMRVLANRSPKLALIGGAMSLVGFLALVGALMPDVVATQLSTGGLTDEAKEFFTRFSNSPIVVALNILALFHVIGAVVLGVALWRTGIVPRWAAAIATFAQMIHFGANVSGVFWLDATTWIGLAASYAMVARVVMKDQAAAASPPS